MNYSKKIFIICIAFCLSSSLWAQVGISTETPDPATQLHVVSPSNNTGVLIPRLTTTQMNAMTSASHSMLIYNTDNNKFMYNAGDAVSQLWTTVGDFPAVEDITSYTTGQIGDIRYNNADDGVYYWNGTAWTKLATSPGP
ncbi:MAG: hypothetical protein PF481_02555 [Bacteroidales bacterium]|nr:hypothetical protein [Bacteroidales bacterium]